MSIKLKKKKTTIFNDIKSAKLRRQKEFPLFRETQNIAQFVASLFCYYCLNTAAHPLLDIDLISKL